MRNEVVERSANGACGAVSERVRYFTTSFPPPLSLSLSPSPSVCPSVSLSLYEAVWRGGGRRVRVERTTRARHEMLRGRMGEDIFTLNGTPVGARGGPALWFALDGEGEL